MDPIGLLLMLLGTSILVCTRDYASVTGEIQPTLFSLNFPEIARRFPRLPDRLGRTSAKGALVFGRLFGVATVVGGAIIAFW